LDYEYITKTDLQRDKYLVLSPKRREVHYLTLCRNLKKNGAKTLKQIGAKIVRKQDKFDEKREYYYLDISQIGSGKYLLENKIYGWDLPGRAKQLARQGDLFVSRLNGSSSKFCIIVDDLDNIVVTNGMFKIVFKDEKQKLNFFFFLATNDFSIQFNALATGSIMEDVKESDLEELLLIPQSSVEENYGKIKRYLSLVYETNQLLK
jgi:restriction endonuclease S subunit